MTTAADDSADEAAFEAFLAGRPVPEEAAALAAFAGAVRATATLPGRPNAALAELLATGLLTDQSSPSTRTAPSAGSPRSRVRSRRRFAMIFPALLAKLLSAGAVAQAATGAGVVLVVATGAGATGLLGEGVQDSITTVVGAETDKTDETASQDPALTGDETATDPGEAEGTEGDTTLVVEPVEEFDPQEWIDNGPAEDQTFGAWVSASAHNDELRAWLRAEGKTFGSMVRDWAHKKGMDDADLVEEGVDLGDLTEEPTTEPVTGETDVVDDTTDTEVASTQGGGGNGRGNGGNGGGNGNGHGKN